MASSAQVPETPVSRISQQIYTTVQAITENYSKGLRKHIMIILGVMLYISSVIMATVYYSPSYYACLAKNGMMWSIANSIVHAFFMVFLLFYVFRSFLAPSEDGSVSYPEGTNGEIREFAEAFSKLVPYGLGLCILFLVVSYGILFFSCRNPIHCEGCSPSKQTAFTDLVTKQVNRTNPMIEKLYKFYEENMGNRHPIASCTNYYSGEYKTMDTGGINTTCGNDLNATPMCVTGGLIEPTTTDPLKGTTSSDPGPMLNQFYIMTSCRTCVVGNQYDGYMSAAMIRVALKAGARCLDFDLCNYGHGKNAFPIVTVPRDRDNYNLQHNFVRFEDVLKTIVDEWINNWPHGAIPRDPLFLHLTLRRGLTKNCMDQIAYLLQYYLNEQQSPGFLLPPKYHYQQTILSTLSLGHMNLCTLFNKIVILVNAPTHAPSPLLDGLINALSGKSMHANIDTTDPDYGYQEMEWKNWVDIEKDKLLDRSRLSLIYVDTSFHPYSSVSEKLLDGEGGLSGDLNAKYPNSDAFNTLLMYKQTINNDPTHALYSGCQFIAMNLQNLDADLKLYLSVFKRTSFVLKPKAMWPKLKTDNPSEPQTECGDDISYMRMTNDKCYTLCVPKDTQNIDVKHPEINNNQFKLIENANDTCLKELDNDGKNSSEYTSTRIVDNTSTEITELRLIGGLENKINDSPFKMFVYKKN